MNEGLKNKGGRPKIVFTDQQIKELEGLSKDMTIVQIADYFGIGESTFREIKSRDSNVLSAYKKGKASGIKEAAGLLWEKMRAGDTTSIIFFLKTQGGWSEKQIIDMTTTEAKLPDLVVKSKTNYEKQLLKDAEVYQ